MITMEKIAEVAYKGYSKKTNNKNFMGKEMPTWEQLPDQTKEAWKAACTSTLVYVLDYLQQSVIDGDGDGQLAPETKS
jgi:hypothetical protein